MNSTRFSSLFVVFLVCSILSGCGSKQPLDVECMTEPENGSSFLMSQKENSSEGPPANELQHIRLVAKPGESPENASKTPVDRKIIYDSIVGLIVDNYPSFERDLPNLVNAHGGFIASNNTNRRHNDYQSGQWIIRVPSDRYKAMVSGLNGLGFAESRSEKAQDVTEEFVDIQARIKNKRALETRVLAILNDRSGKLNEILEIERELSRVREEIERMEGRLRYLTERTSLATITINCREQQEYAHAGAPTLLARLGQSWAASTTSLGRSATSLLVLLVGLAPWALFLGAAAWIASWSLPRLRAFANKRATVS